MLTFRAGDADRHGKGTAWRFWSRRCDRQVRFPTGAIYEYSLPIEFDPTVKSFLEQPEIEGEEGKRLDWPQRNIWLYVERINGRRELHCAEDLRESADVKVKRIAQSLQEGGLRFISTAGKEISEMRLRNLIRLSGLVGPSDPAVPVCAEQISATSKSGTEVAMSDLFDVAAAKGSATHVAARAIACLIHDGVLTADLDAEEIGPQMICKWAP